MHAKNKHICQKGDLQEPYLLVKFDGHEPKVGHCVNHFFSGFVLMSVSPLTYAVICPCAQKTFDLIDKMADDNSKGSSN
jgi:hypothetical protein